VSPEPVTDSDLDASRHRLHVAWRVAQDEREQPAPSAADADADADADASQALRDWARALAARIKALSDRLDVPLSQDPSLEDLLALQQRMEQLRADWGRFLADEDAAVLRVIDEDYWQQSSDERERARREVETFPAKLDRFRRLLGAVNLQGRLDLADDLALADRNIALLQERREQFGEDRARMVAAVIPLLAAIARL
jgi:hypothetical protein